MTLSVHRTDQVHHQRQTRWAKTIRVLLCLCLRRTDNYHSDILPTYRKTHLFTANNARADRSKFRRETKSCDQSYDGTCFYVYSLLASAAHAPTDGILRFN